jgi:hypothetical protein
MKMRMRLVYSVILLVTAAACAKREGAAEASTADEWPEMDAFHKVMAEAYHPFKDSSNVGPVKRLAEEMAQEAEKWQAAPLPEKVSNDQTKAQLEKLAGDARALSDQIKGGAKDDEIGRLLTQLHESFHAIMEAWNGEGEAHKH